MPKANSNPKQNQNNQKKKKTRRSVRKKSMNGQSQTTAPVSVGIVGKVNSPKMNYKNAGTVCVSHTELIGDVNGSVGLNVATYSINAGLSTMFVWLSNMASNYESYKFRKLHFRYVQACATTATGQVYLTVEFDPSDVAPSSEQQLATYDGVVYGTPWANHIYKCALRNLSKRSSYFTRIGTLSNSADLPLYDVGYLVVATTGNASTALVGKIWVDYEVELVTPQLGSIAVGRSLSANFSGADNFVTVPAKAGNAQLTASVAANVLTITAQQPYSSLLSFTVAGTGLVSVALAGTAVVTAVTNVTNAGGTASVVGANVNFANVGDTLTITIASPTTVTATRARFGQYNTANA